MSDSEDITTAGCLAVVIFLPAHVVIDAIAVMKLWGWYLVPLGVPGVVWQQAIGISVLASLLTHQYTERKDGGVSGFITHSLIAPLLALFVGWLFSGYAR